MKKLFLSIFLFGSISIMCDEQKSLPEMCHISSTLRSELTFGIGAVLDKHHPAQASEDLVWSSAENWKPQLQKDVQEIIAKAKEKYSCGPDFSPENYKKILDSVCNQISWQRTAIQADAHWYNETRRTVNFSAILTGFCSVAHASLGVALPMIVAVGRYAAGNIKKDAALEKITHSGKLFGISLALAAAAIFIEEVNQRTLREAYYARRHYIEALDLAQKCIEQAIAEAA
jgi:hypothetical protein